MKKSGYTTDASPDALHMHPYLISPGKVRAIRDRIRALVVRVAALDSPRRAVEATKLLCDALAEPVAYFGKDIPSESIAAWENDDLATLDSLRDVVDASTEPLVRLEIRDHIDWHTRYGGIPAIRSGCDALMDILDDHLEDLLTHILIGSVWSSIEPRGRRASLSTRPEDQSAVMGDHVAGGAAESADEPNADPLLDEPDLKRMEARHESELSYVVKQLGNR